KIVLNVVVCWIIPNSRIGMHTCRRIHHCRRAIIGIVTALHEAPRPFPFHDPDQYTLHIVKFKANRTDVFYLAKEKKLDLQVKDYVIVDGDRGTDLGMVSKVNVTEAEARALTAQLQRELAAATAANQNGMGANAMEAIAAAASQVNERDV